MPELSAETRAIIDALRETKGDVERQIALLLSEQRLLRERQDKIIAGFPDGDPDSHRRYHESIIEWRELRNQMVKSALMQAAKVGGMGAFCWVMYALWQAAKMEIMK